MAKERKTETIQARVSRDVKLKIKAKMQENDISEGAVIRAALKNFFINEPQKTT